MSTNHAQPDQRGTRSTERKPQVVVRAGKTFLCSSCGTLVEVPADVVGQLVVAVDSSPQEAPAEPSVADEQPPQVEPDPTVTPAKSSSGKDSPRPSHSPKHRPPRPSAPKKSHLVGEMIDGLKVPTAKQLDRALAWVSFHLKVLDRQGSEIKRLKKLLKKQPTYQVPHPNLGERTQEVTAQVPVELASISQRDPARADLGVVTASCAEIINERGPP